VTEIVKPKPSGNFRRSVSLEGSRVAARYPGLAVAYLLKGSAVAELELAIRAVARGQTYLSPPVSKHMVDDYVSRTGGATDPLAALTPRQCEILQLVAEGHTSRRSRSASASATGPSRCIAIN
jgi:DNA-binding NarL/FixJ family response regulator